MCARERPAIAVPDVRALQRPLADVWSDKVDLSELVLISR
jgi:hypothetical protein